MLNHHISSFLSLIFLKFSSHELSMLIFAIISDGSNLPPLLKSKPVYLEFSYSP
jgi:hypothetical protein